MKVPQHKEILTFSQLEVGDTFRYVSDRRMHYAMKIHEVGEKYHGASIIRNMVRLSDGALFYYERDKEVEKVEGMFVFKRKKGN